MPDQAINLAVMVAYLLGILALGVFMSRYVKTVRDFFLAGRALNHWVVAGTIMATNIAAIWLVGPAGGAYAGGAKFLVIAWSGNMIAALSAIIFVPRLRRLRLTTVSEILETRYGTAIRMLPAFAWIVYYALFAGTAMYTFSLTMNAVLSGRPDLGTEDITDWQGFCGRLGRAADEPSPSARIWEFLPGGARQIAAKAAGGGELTDWQKRRFVDDMNLILKQRRGFHSQAHFAGVSIPSEAADLLARPREELTGEHVLKLNRLVLAAAFPQEITEAPRMWPLWLIILIIGPIVVAYCYAAGLLAVAFTDVIQAFLVVLGGVILLPLALKAVGGIAGLKAGAPEGHLLVWSGGLGWSWKDMFMWIILGLPYWCTSQYMLQRTFGARSVRDASRGLALAALLTGVLTLTYIVPGLCGTILYSGGNALDKADMVLPSLFRDVLPVGLGGLFIAALVAASNSTASSLLNSIATLFEHDVYRRFRPGLAERHYTWIGRMATLVAGAGAIAFALAVPKLGGIISAIYSVMSWFEPPIFVIVAGALFWRRPSTVAAGATLIGGITFNTAAFCLGWPPADICLWGFPLCAVVFVAATFAVPNTRVEQTEAMLTAMNRKTRALPTPLTWVGLALAEIAIIAFIMCACGEAQLPKPWNIAIFMALMTLFVLGIYVAIPGLVGEESLNEEERRDDEEGRREIDASLISRIVGSWKTWAAVYAAATVLGVALYAWA